MAPRRRAGNVETARRRTRRGIVLALLLFAGTGGQPAAAAETGEARLIAFWDDWQTRVAPLLSDEEALFFSTLADDRERELFAAAFWHSRGQAALERWRANREAARRRRARAPWEERLVQLAGVPARIHAYPRCPPLRRLEIWRWEPWNLALQGAPSQEAVEVSLVETSALDPRTLEPWSPGDLDRLAYGGAANSGVESLLGHPEIVPCLGVEGERLRRQLATVLPLEELLPRLAWPQPGSRWLRRLRDDLDDGLAAGRGGAELELSFPGSFADRYTIVRGRLRVRADRLREIAPGQLFDRVTVSGDVYRGTVLADGFEIVHQIAGTAPGPQVDLDFYRRLRPGTYLLRLRVADRYDLALLRRDLRLEVPSRPLAAPEPAGHAVGLSHLTRRSVVVLTTFPSVELLPPDHRGGDRIRLTAITTGGPIAAVEFRHPGERLATVREPPYTVELDLWQEGVEIEAVALDPAGRRLASDRRRLAPRRAPFAVRFGRRVTSAESIPILLSLPAEAGLERVDCYRARKLVATLRTPPFACPGSESGEEGYLTVKATLTDGESTEDVLFLGPGQPEEVEVRLVELSAAVVDVTGRPATGLGPGDFRVVERGGERPVVRAETLRHLPLNAALLMDLSSSMGRRARLAAASARRFFDTLLTAGDRASLLAFNHDLDLVVPFTGDPERLRAGAAGLAAWGSTRLYDAVVWALFQFTGLENQRALIVLSDGADVGSDFPPEVVLDAALSAGVTVYPIVLGGVDPTTAGVLGSLAERTGGRWFAISSAARLDAVYRQITDELRARYLLVYQPGPAASISDLPLVEVIRPGYMIRDLRGYRPLGATARGEP